MDYQIRTLYGDTTGAGGLDATMLNPAAAGPNDWQTVLTNGFANSALYGLNGWMTNQLNAGAIANQQAAQQAGLTLAGTRNGLTIGGNILPMLMVGAILYAVLK
jgi:hypothetical protein